MKIIDARHGDEVKVGQTVRYPEGEWWRLEGVIDWGPVAWALVRDHTMTSFPDAPPKRVRLVVRFFHPAFLLQRVGFFPS